MPGGILGLEIAKSGLFANQRAIDVTGQNIANVNNEDYHRQRVRMTASSPLLPLGFPGGTLARQIGTGVDVSSIERIRDAFLERRIREETEDLGQFEKAFDFLHQVELIYNEPSENSLRARADEFWKTLEDLANDPEDLAVRAAVRESAFGVTEMIGQQAAEFLRLGGDTLDTSVNREIAVIVDSLNGAAQELSQLSKQIQLQEAGGHNPNDLLDQRDGLIKKLSRYVDVRVSDGDKENFLVTVGGLTLSQGVSFNQFELRTKSDGKTGIFVRNTQTELLPNNGELKALFKFRDEQLPAHIKGLADFAMTLVEKTNDIHKNAFGLDGSTNVNFFKPFTTQTSGVYKITGTTNVRYEDLALNGGLYGQVQAPVVNAALNNSANFNNTITGGSQTLTFNDINARDLNSDGTQDVFDTSTDVTVSYNADTDTLESIVNKINLNVFGATSPNPNRTGALATIVDKKLIINGAYQVADTGNLLVKLGMNMEKENFENTSIHTTTYPTGVFRVGKGELSINQYKVKYDGNLDSLTDIVRRINELRMGVVAEVNEQKKIVLRGTSATDFKISQLSDSANLFERLGVLQGSTTFEMGVPIADSGTDVSTTANVMDSLTNNINRGRVGRGFLIINGIDVVSGTSVDSPPGNVNDLPYDGSSTYSLENIRDFINAAFPPAGSGSVVAQITDDNRLIVTGVTSWRDTGDFSQVLRMVPRSKVYSSGDSVSEGYVTGRIERPPTENFAFQIDLSTEVKNDLRKIAAAGGVDQDLDGIGDQSLGPGNGDSALKMAALKHQRILDNNSATMDQFFGALIAQVGIEVRLSDTNRQTQLDVIGNIDLLNKSISGVSLDEEMTNLMKYQRGFQASARLLTTTDRMIDVILNMGS